MQQYGWGHKRYGITGFKCKIQLSGFLTAGPAFNFNVWQPFSKTNKNCIFLQTAEHFASPGGATGFNISAGNSPGTQFDSQRNQNYHRQDQVRDLLIVTG